MLNVIKAIDPSIFLSVCHNNLGYVSLDFKIFGERIVNFVTISSFEEHIESFLTFLLLSTNEDKLALIEDVETINGLIKLFNYIEILGTKGIQVLI